MVWLQSLMRERRAAAWRHLNVVERDVLIVVTALCKVRNSCCAAAQLVTSYAHARLTADCRGQPCSTICNITRRVPADIGRVVYGIGLVSCYSCYSAACFVIDLLFGTHGH
jgi:hypothetical protein